MTTSKTGTTKAANYTPEQEAAIRNAAPITFESAEALAKKIGKTQRGVISKAKQLGVEYIPKQAAKKRGTPKADLIAKIANHFSMAESDLEGLEKATAQALQALIDKF